MSKLSKIKAGKRNHKLVNFPGTEEKVALAVLTSIELTEAKIAAEKEVKAKDIPEDFHDIIFQKHIIYRSLRDKENLKEKLADSLDELQEILDTQEISFLMTEYTLMTQEDSPFLATLTEEQFEQLKKTLEKIQWKDLSGQSLVALRNFLVSLVS